MSEEFDTLFLWWGAEASEIEKETWRQFQLITKTRYPKVIFIEAISKEEFDTTYQQLREDGWKDGRFGSGVFGRMLAWTK